MPLPLPSASMPIQALRTSALVGILHSVAAMAAASQEAVGWLDYKLTKQGASPNEIYAKLVPFFTQAAPGSEYPPGMVFLFGGCLWIGFMLFIGLWVVRFVLLAVCSAFVCQG
eukprot:COSAG02_NODE_801_length_17030_cov_150.308428_16_plen_113_part_00